VTVRHEAGNRSDRGARFVLAFSGAPFPGAAIRPDTTKNPTKAQNSAAHSLHQRYEGRKKSWVDDK